MLVQSRGQDGAPVTTQDVNNWVRKIKKEQRGDRLDIQALLDRLTQENVPHDYAWDEERKLISLIIFPAKSLDLSLQHSSVLLLDCSYKTNR
jgi:hypothetical protein